MPNRGSFQGKRKEFLTGKLDEYGQAVQDGEVADKKAQIIRSFLLQFPLDKDENWEPTDEELAKFDEDTPAKEPDRDLHAMTAEERQQYQEAERIRARGDEKKGEQIARWLRYHHNKRNPSTKSMDNKNDPLTILLRKLAGITDSEKPCRKTAATVWAHENADVIEPLYEAKLGRVKEREKETGVKEKSSRLTLHQRIVREEFAKLTSDEKEKWTSESKEQHENAIEEWEQKQALDFSSDPAARQSCIANLPSFVQPILDGICEATGWTATLIVGGPEPADQGCLNVVSIHSGKTRGRAPQTFGTAMRREYKAQILPVFGEYLKRCYTIADCRARALGANDEMASLADAHTEAINADRFDLDAGDAGFNEQLG
ncbi:hypothetical protein K435DRAFT_880234, partial [Dendrothele bispora CBS 962.96]